MTDPAKLKPHDRVVYRFFSTCNHGSVQKVAKATAIVEFDDGTFERVSLGTLRQETAEDVARRDHEQALRAWQDLRPKTSCVRVSSTPYQGSDPTGVEIVGVLRVPEFMRAASSELLLLADWFAARPVKP